MVYKQNSRAPQSKEPDCVRLYTKMWCELNEIPAKWQELLFQLATHTTRAPGSSGQDGRLVLTGGVAGREMRAALGWQERQWYKGLRELCGCGAIRKVGRGEYQISPSYTGHGQWKYDPRLEQGGVRDIEFRFDLKTHTSDTRFVWADGCE